MPNRSWIGYTSSGEVDVEALGPSTLETSYGGWFRSLLFNLPSSVVPGLVVSGRPPRRRPGLELMAIKG